MNADVLIMPLPSALPQVVPPGATAKWPLELRSHDVRSIRQKLEYCINGCHFFVRSCRRQGAVVDLHCMLARLQEAAKRESVCHSAAHVFNHAMLARSLPIQVTGTQARPPPCLWHCRMISHKAL